MLVEAVARETNEGTNGEFHLLSPSVLKVLRRRTSHARAPQVKVKVKVKVNRRKEKGERRKERERERERESKWGVELARGDA